MHEDYNGHEPVLDWNKAATRLDAADGLGVQAPELTPGRIRTSRKRCCPKKRTPQCKAQIVPKFLYKMACCAVAILNEYIRLVTCQQCTNESYKKWGVHMNHACVSLACPNLAQHLLSPAGTGPFCVQVLGLNGLCFGCRAWFRGVRT